jgi:hypothetical protein
VVFLSPSRIMSVNYQVSIRSRVMAKAINRRPVKAEARVRSRVTPCGISGGQSGSETGCSQSSLLLYYRSPYFYIAWGMNSW